MRVFRIEREKYLPQVLSGYGAARSEYARWNGLHTRMVYTSGSRALALLEIAVHLDLSEDLPTDRFFVEIDIPDHLAYAAVPQRSLPPNWLESPPLRETQFLGDQFVADAKTVILRVPSSIVPMEYNYLINPLHADAGQIRVVEQQRLNMDTRFRLKLST